MNLSMKKTGRPYIFRYVFALYNAHHQHLHGDKSECASSWCHGCWHQVMDLFMTIFNFFKHGLLSRRRTSPWSKAKRASLKRHTRKHHVKYGLWHLFSHHHLRLWLQHLKFY